MDAPLITTLIAVALVLVYIMAIVSALEVIMKARTSQGAVAWTISLLTLPYITVPLYLVFGRNKFDGYLEQRDEIEKESLRLIRQTSGLIEHHIVPVSNDTPLYASLFNLARMPATTGNRVELLIDGQQTFYNLLAGLAGAEKFILFMPGTGGQGKERCQGVRLVR